MEVWNRFFKRKADHTLIYFVLFPASQIWLIITLFYVLMFNELKGLYYNLLYIGIVFCVVSHIGIFVVINKMRDKLRLEEQLRMYELQLDAQMQHYQQLRQSRQEMRAMKHDFNNQIQTVLALISSGHKAEAEDLVDNLSKELERRQPISFTSNLVLDALLAVKYQAALEREIKSDIQVEMREEVGIKNLHLCRVAANLLDNSLEACEALKESEITPYIRFNVKEQKNFLVIRSENAVDPAAKITGGKRPATTKGDKDQHGIGLRNVERIAKEYRGSVQYESGESAFSVTVFLEIKDAAASVPVHGVKLDI